MPGKIALFAHAGRQEGQFEHLELRCTTRPFGLSRSHLHGVFRKEDERTIRGMVDQAILRLNRGDVSGFADFGTRMLIMLELTAN